MAANKGKINLSIPKSMNVCGYEIKKMPIRAYLSAVQRLQTFPQDILETCFPGIELQEVINNLTKMDDQLLKVVMVGLFHDVPLMLIELVSDLSGIPGNELMDNEDIGIDGLFNIVLAMIEVNQLGECFAQMKEIGIKLKATIKQTPNIGSKG